MFREGIEASSRKTSLRSAPIGLRCYIAGDGQANLYFISQISEVTQLSQYQIIMGDDGGGNTGRRYRKTNSMLAIKLTVDLSWFDFYLNVRIEIQKNRSTEHFFLPSLSQLISFKHPKKFGKQ